MSLFSSRKTEFGVVFNIGSSSVTAGLVRFDKDLPPHVVYTVKESIPYQEQVDPDRFLKEMIEALKRVNSRLAKDGLAHLKFTEFGSSKIKKIVYTFSSPWSVTQTKIITIKEPNDFTLTHERVDKLVDAHEKIFETETFGGAAGGEAEMLTVIEKRVMEIKLNGYADPEPYGKRARQADISIFISLVPKAVIEKVFEVSAATYHPRDTEIYSFPLVSYSVIRDVFHTENDFIFLDIGGELSEVSVIKGGLILETASFPLGRHFLVRKIKKAFATTTEEAASLIRLYEEGNGSKDTQEKLGPQIAAAAQEWKGALETVLGKISTKMTLPTSLFVVINNDLVQFFMRILREEKIAEFGVTVPLSVTLVNHDKLRSAVEFGKHADKDPFVALTAAFAGRVYESKDK